MFKLILTPESIIKRCLWMNFKKFVLKNKSEEEIQRIVEENKPFELLENDAYVIGLLRIVETDNLVHRFNVDIEETLRVKSTIHEINGDKKVLVSKSSILKETLLFKNNFPEYYKPDTVYQKSIEDVADHVNKLYKEFCALEDISVTIKDKNYTFVLTADIRKILKRHNAIPID